jgi:hypothetical protein
MDLAFSQIGGLFLEDVSPALGNDLSTRLMLAVSYVYEEINGARTFDFVSQDTLAAEFSRTSTN